MNTFIVGAGATGRIVHSLVKEHRSTQYGRVVFAADTTSAVAVFGVPVYPIDAEHVSAGDGFYMAIGFSRMNNDRERVVGKMMALGAVPLGLSSKTAHRGNAVIVGDGCIMLENSSIHACATIGRFVFIGANTNIGHDCDICDFAWINSGVSLAGGVSVGHHSFIGVNACLAHGVRIAPYTYIGAGVVLSRDTKDGEVFTAPEPILQGIESARFVMMQGLLK
jgi:acetyltransferase-like isoleucine patch superfamily enzyme